MATQDLNTTTDDYFAYAGVFEQLAASVKKHDPDAYIRAGNTLDMGGVVTLRGLSYMAWVLANTKVEDRHVSLHDTAVATIAEMTSFVAKMLEFQNDADTLDSLREYAQPTT